LEMLTVLFALQDPLGRTWTLNLWEPDG
jgi:hypothetical protein